MMSLRLSLQQVSISDEYFQLYLPLLTQPTHFDLIPGDDISTLTDSSDEDKGKTSEPSKVEAAGTIKSIFQSLVSPHKKDSPDLVVRVEEDTPVQPGPPSLEDRVRSLGNSAKSFIGGLAAPFSSEKPKVVPEGSITSGADNAPSVASGAGKESSFDFKTPARNDLIGVFDNAATDDKTPRNTNSSKRAKISTSSTKSNKLAKKVRQYHTHTGTLRERWYTI